MGLNQPEIILARGFIGIGELVVKSHNSRHVTWVVFLGLSLLPGLFFVWLFYERYWRWRDCIEAAASSCITPDGANLTSGGMIWGFFAVIFLSLPLVVYCLRPAKKAVSGSHGNKAQG